MGKTIGVVLALQDKCSPQLNKIAERLNISEKEAKKLHNQVGKLSKKLSTDLKNAAKIASVGMAAVSAACAGVTYKTMEAGDRIDKMSQKMQLSRKSFQELDYVFTQSGASIESMDKGILKLSQSMVKSQQGDKNSITLFKQLGISVKDTTGHLRKTEDVMFDALQTLQKMPAGAQRTALAVQLFGKSANELEPLLNKGSKGVNELRKKFNELGMGMSDKTIEASVKFKDTMDSLTRSAQGIGYELGGELLPIVQSVADKIIVNMPKIKATVTPVIKGIGSIISTVIDTMNIWMPVMAGVIAAIGTFKVISGTITVIKTLKTVIDAVRVAQGLWNVIMLANPIGLIAVGVGALVGGVILLWKNWDKIIEKVKIAFDWMKKVVDLKIGKKKVDIEVSKTAAAGVAPQHGLPKETTTSKENKKNDKITQQYASGTVFSHGGVSLVGENGPEIVDIPRGSRVYNSSETKNMITNGGNTYNFYFGDVYDKDEFIYKIRQALGSALNTAMAV